MGEIVSQGVHLERNHCLNDSILSSRRLVRDSTPRKLYKKDDDYKRESFKLCKNYSGQPGSVSKVTSASMLQNEENQLMLALKWPSRPV